MEPESAPLETLAVLAEKGVPAEEINLMIPLDTLRAHRKDAVMRLRMASAENSLGAITRVLSDWEAEHVVEERFHPRDFLQLIALNAGLLCEAIRLISRFAERPWALARLAVEQRYYQFDETAARQLFDKGPDTLYAQFFARWRDKSSFHWDSDQFETYLDKVEATEWNMWRWPKGSLPKLPLAPYSPVAMVVLGTELYGFPQADGEMEGRHRAAIRAIVAAQNTVRILTEAAIFGFLIESGLEPAKCMTPPLKLVR